MRNSSAAIARTLVKRGLEHERGERALARERADRAAAERAAPADDARAIDARLRRGPIERRDHRAAAIEASDGEPDERP